LATIFITLLQLGPAFSWLTPAHGKAAPFYLFLAWALSCRLRTFPVVGEEQHPMEVA
jgi:hypothetical protein